MKIDLTATKHAKSCAGLTLIEIVVTLVIIALAFALVGSRLGISNYWKQEAFLRKLRETISFLYQQAVVDQTFYQLQFDFQKQEYKVYAMTSDATNEGGTNVPQEDVGYLTQELAAVLSPAVGTSYSLVSPPSFPSLGEPVTLPGEMRVTSIKTPRGEFDAREDDLAYILFSPRGFSEFAVLHFDQGAEGKDTIVVNPFVGSTELYRDDRDFDWDYGRENRDER